MQTMTLVGLFRAYHLVKKHEDGSFPQEKCVKM